MPTTSPPGARSPRRPARSTCSSRAPKPTSRSARVKDGDVLELGNVTATVMHTPGHTPEHISLLVTDRTRAAEPWFVLTGHTLMVGDLGRTELASSAEDGARALFASVRRLKELPDHVEVLPGAYSGSVCGRSLSGKPTSTIGFERRFNKAFRIEDEDGVRLRHDGGHSAAATRRGTDARRECRFRGRRAAVTAIAQPREIALGLKANWRQFSLLVLINAFVGGMVGIERTVVPLIGTEEFGIASTTLVVSFIVSFGVVKAFANLVSGQLADKWGRKRVLVLGWLFGLPVPFMILWAPSWDWVIAANALLGVSQGFAWSMTVIMKIDLVGPKGRGLAVGPERVRRLSRRRRHRLPDRLSRRAVRPAPGADLSRRRLRGSRHGAFDPAGARHARPCPAGDGEPREGSLAADFPRGLRADLLPRPQPLRRFAGRAGQQPQ